MVEFACEAVWSWTFVCRECFYYIFNLISSDQSVQLIYFFFDSVLAGCMSLESYPFLLGYQICWHIIVHSILSLFRSLSLTLFFFFCFVLFCFVFLQYLLRFRLFPFLFSLFGFSPSSSWWVWPEGLSIFFTFSKNHLLVLSYFILHSWFMPWILTMILVKILQRKIMYAFV